MEVFLQSLFKIETGEEANKLRKTLVMKAIIEFNLPEDQNYYDGSESVMKKFVDTR